MKYSEGCLLDGRYQLKRFIGSGTFGEVWVANDTATDLEVAIKVYVSMDETGYKEFKKEFQISFELNHSNLLHANYLGVNPEDKCPYLVMPFCPDGSVSRHIGSMSEADMWRFIRDVASGLAYLHSMNPPIIHQDIKPDNILILRNGDFVITDFGISKQLRATLRKSANSLNSAGAISYMGPERFSKQYQAVKASDIWSLGASIFELATEELPFCGMGGSLLKQGADMPELPEQYSRELNMICQSCMTKETWNRPTAQQLADFASRYIDGETPKITWKIAADIEIPENVIVEGQDKPAVAPQAPDNASQAASKSNADMKKTMVNAASAFAENKTVAFTPNVSEPAAEVQPAPEAKFAIKSDRKAEPIAAWVWVVVAIAGLAFGLVLNYLS
jgi:serine/threonine protein kinase